MTINAQNKKLKVDYGILKNSRLLYSFFAFLILSFVAYYQLFYALDRLPLRVWDEGRNAVSAYEMNANGNYIVRYYEGQPDNWDFKPPFLIWNQVISIKLFGINEFATRFPSSLYAFFTAALIFFFLNSKLKKPFVGLLGALILLTSYGYLERHIARFGDHDSILVFFLTSQLLLFHKYITTDKKGYLYLFTLALILASFTKGVAGLFFVPGIALYLILSGRFKKIIFDRSIYFCILTFILFIGGYYAFQEISAPGYLKAVWENELLPRYTNTANNYKYEHTSDYFFYIKNLWNKRLTPWIYAVPFVMLFLFLSKDKRVKPIYLYILTVGISFLGIISGGSKALWYDAPLFPIFAICLALGFFLLYIFMKKKLKREYIAVIISLLIIAPFLFISIQKTKKLTFQIKERSWNYEVQGISYFLRDHSEEIANLQKIGIAYEGYHSHIRFYSNIVSNSGTTAYFMDYTKLDTPSIVIASQKKVQEFIEANYIFTKEKKDFGTYVYTIIARKAKE